MMPFQFSQSHFICSLKLVRGSLENAGQIIKGFLIIGDKFVAFSLQMADKILSSRQVWVGLEQTPEGEVRKVTRLCPSNLLFAGGRLRIGGRGQLSSLSAVSTVQPCRKCEMWAAEVKSTFLSFQGNRTPSVRVIPGKPQLTLPVTSDPGLLNSWVPPAKELDSWGPLWEMNGVSPGQEDWLEREQFLALEIPMAAITQQACFLWTIARGKGTGYTESKIEISLMDDFSQQLAVTY